MTPSVCTFASEPGYAGCAMLALRGELDITDAAELSSQLTSVMSGESWVIVDLADLAFIDCSSLGVMADARERARLAGGDVLLAGPRGAVTRLLLLTGWDRVFSVFPGVGLAGFSAGLAAFSSRLAVSRAGESVAAASRQGYRGAA
jgi:anti-sigma B factor antagonist